jgi:hypothetical protein
MSQSHHSPVSRIAQSFDRSAGLESSYRQRRADIDAIARKNHESRKFGEGE